MKKISYHYDHTKLPKKTKSTLPVQMYSLSGLQQNGISFIGNSLPKSIKQLGVVLPNQAMDFLSIALAVTAADTFIKRDDSENAWAREIVLKLPLCEPSRWNGVKKKLEETLHFLSGDIWSFNFSSNGYPSPIPSKIRQKEKLFRLNGLNCICLFSGGVDSAIGAIDLISEKYKPLLVSHAYRGDSKFQNKIKAQMYNHGLEHFEHYQFNADPHFCEKKTDISMRTRSLNFISFGVLCGCALRSVNKYKTIDFVMPENGFISLNAPLTKRRIGSLSTRTTHYRFISSIQEILNAVGIPISIRNPYNFKTKGEMVLECKDQKLLNAIVDSTVSCSHWKRNNKQCGICVPCVVRRAALFTGGIAEREIYKYDISDVENDIKKRDSIYAVKSAISQLKSKNIRSWILNSGSLPFEYIGEYEKIFIKGLKEIESYMKVIQ